MRVLIIDDEADLVEMLQLRLQALGRYEIETAYDGDEGLAKAKSDHPDVVLLDTVMPKVDGWEVCRRLKADPQTRDTKVVVMTAAGAGAQKSAQEAGADELMLKPYEFNDLVSLLASLEGRGSTPGTPPPPAS